MSLWHRVLRVLSDPAVVGHGVKIIVIIVVAAIVSLVANRALRRLAGRARQVEGVAVIEGRRAVTAVSLIGSVVRWTVLVIAAITILRECGLDIGPLLAGAGIVGLAVAFGSQALVRDLVSGLFIALEGQLAVGDKAEVNGLYGVVDEIGLRTTRLLLPGGSVQYFANGAITSIKRYPAGAAPYVVSVPAARDKIAETRDAARSILADLDAEQGLFANPVAVRDVLELATYGAVIRFAAQVLPAAKAAFEANVAARVTTLLAERGLVLPEGRQVVVQPEIASAEKAVG
jgi:small conductance mechanosensitive channel